MTATDISNDSVLRATRGWLEHAVIGLNLCPFAKAVWVRRLIRFSCSAATDTATLRRDLVDELCLLRDTPVEQLETTLLVHPWVLGDFLDFNDFLDTAEAALRELHLEGSVQIASFHPHYRFAGTAADDAGNASNRSPYPCLHLLRESSIDRAVAAFPQPEAIYESNIATLRGLGAAGWASLQSRWLGDTPPPA